MSDVVLTDEKFWSKVEKTDTCWLWTGPRLPNGYGRLWLNGRLRTVHRLAWELARGPIPDGLVIDHACRVRNCVNPDHMEVVTGGDNTRRGIGPTAINARKTHCIRGHEFTPENTYWPAKGGRICRACARQRQVGYEKALRQCGHLRHATAGSQPHAAQAQCARPPRRTDRRLPAPGRCGVSGEVGGGIYAEVKAERDRAHAKHGDTSMEAQPCDHPMRLSILMEEVGEVAKEFNEGRHRGEGPDLTLLRAELVQVAAMSTAWADAIPTAALTPAPDGAGSESGGVG